MRYRLSTPGLFVAASDRMRLQFLKNLLKKPVGFREMINDINDVLRVDKQCVKE